MNTRKRKYDQANGQPGESGSSTRRMSEDKKENSGSIGSRRSPRTRKEIKTEKIEESSSSTMTTAQETEANEDDQEERIQLDKKLRAEKVRVNDDLEQNENQSEVITGSSRECSAPNDLPASTTSEYITHSDSHQPQGTVVVLSNSHETINSLPRTTVTLASSVPYSVSNPDIISSTSTKYHSNFSDSDEDDENKTDPTLITNIRGRSNIAILNKTKINTDYIAKILPAHNSQANDPRYDPNEINKLRLLSHSYQNFAVKLLTRLFDEEEIIGRNVYGRNYSGDRTVKKQPLDPERIEFIKETVLRLTKTNNPELAWASCVIAMNRKMVDINNKYQKIVGNGGQK